MIVLDASAVLAVIFQEPGGDLVVQNALGSWLSAVNYAEVVTKVVDQGFDADRATRAMRRLRPQLSPFDQAQAQRTGELRTATAGLGLSLGDRACLALAETLDATVLTADRNWARLNLGIRIELIR